MAAVTIPQIYAQMSALGCAPAIARKFCAICLRETGGTLDLLSHNYNPPIEDSWGIFQINLLAHGDKINQAGATDFVTSCKFAYNLYKANNFEDWKGTANDSELKSLGFYDRVDRELTAAGLDPTKPFGGTWAEGNSDDWTQGVKDFLIIVAIELVAFMCIGIGLWGIANGKQDIGSAIKSATNTATGLATTAVKAAVNPALAATDAVAKKAKG